MSVLHHVTKAIYKPILTPHLLHQVFADLLPLGHMMRYHLDMGAIVPYTKCAITVTCHVGKQNEDDNDVSLFDF
jgi:hypothetical protein